ncbi:hypothetical protein BGP_2769 [Beggiatoa sp. PS]|nr:hypothetical protein BGP_2769 [Beggiatoa sp. PS]
MANLEQRLKALEIEQDQQQVVLETDLSNFHEDLRKLEKTLETIDSYIMAQVKNDFEADYGDDTIRMQKELEDMEKVEHQQFGKASQVKKNTQTSSPPPSENMTPTYVICLVFNPKAPQEWSGKGWCEMGKGMHYSQLEQAKKIAQRLKKQWPNYPLKIFKR